MMYRIQWSSIKNNRMNKNNKQPVVLKQKTQLIFYTGTNPSRWYFNRETHLHTKTKQFKNKNSMENKKKNTKNKTSYIGKQKLDTKPSVTAHKLCL